MVFISALSEKEQGDPAALKALNVVIFLAL
jgi:hypothetical protein